jgi:hypothetical protein
MKISKNDLRQLIKEELRQSSSVLLETPELDENMHQAPADDKDPDGYEGHMARKSLYHMAAQSQQLHDMLQDDENLEPWVQAKITKAADYLEAAFKSITYEKGPGKGDLK